MGGRGRSSELGIRQITIGDAIKQREIADIILESTKKRVGLIGSGISGGGGIPRLLKKCACCDEYTVPLGSEYEICSICGWIDDEYQNKHPDSLQGKNNITLTQARVNYQQNT